MDLFFSCLPAAEDTASCCYSTPTAQSAINPAPASLGGGGLSMQSPSQSSAVVVFIPTSVRYSNWMTQCSSQPGCVVAMDYDRDGAVDAATKQKATQHGIWHLPGASRILTVLISPLMAIPNCISSKVGVLSPRKSSSAQLDGVKIPSSALAFTG